MARRRYYASFHVLIYNVLQWIMVHCASSSCPLRIYHADMARPADVSTRILADFAGMWYCTPSFFRSTADNIAVLVAKNKTQKTA